jgi:hypothetical protein
MFLWAYFAVPLRVRIFTLTLTFVQRRVIAHAYNSRLNFRLKNFQPGPGINRWQD